MYQAVLALLAPEIFISIMAAIILIVGVYNKRSQQNICYFLSIFTLVAVVVMTFNIMPIVSQAVFNGAYIVDRFACVLKIILYIFSNPLHA